MRYSFKFLSSYTQDDQEIFFGRDEEIESLYSKIFQSSMIVVYGASGTGKTSLINCGLARKFQPHDWFPVMVRRGTELNKSLEAELIKLRGKPVTANAYAGWIEDDTDESEEVDSTFQTAVEVQQSPVCTAIRELYQKYFKPVYLIFDQFEELFILGSSKEEKSFINTIKDILQSGLPVKLIFSIREEYLGYLYEFERVVPQLMRRTLRIEPMNFEKVNQVILGVSGYEDSIVKIKPGEAGQVAQGVFDKIKGKGKTLTIQLPILQVFLHKFYMNITGDESHIKPAEFSVAALKTMEEIDDVMVDFLAEQVQGISMKLRARYPSLTPEVTWKILSPFSTIEGTKDPISREELYERLPGTDRAMTDEVVGEFMGCQILRRDPTSQLIELTHDSLAKPIADRRSVDEKTLLEVKRLIFHQVSVNEQARSHFDERQMMYIEPYLEKIRLSPAEEGWINDSRRKIDEEKVAEKKMHEEELAKARKRSRILGGLLIFAFAAVITAGVLGINANKQKLRAETEQKKTEVEKAKADENWKKAEIEKVKAENEKRSADSLRKIADIATAEAKDSKAQADRSAKVAEQNAREARSNSKIARENAFSREIAAIKALQAQKQAALSAIDAVNARQRADISQKIAERKADTAREALLSYQRLKSTSIGSMYQGGMIVSWSDQTGQHGVIALTEDLPVKYSWKDAKIVCDTLTLGGYTDWRLPHRSELALLYANKNMIGGFYDLPYWSDQAAGSLGLQAWCQLFSTGFTTGRFKSSLYSVRPVRDF